MREVRPGVWEDHPMGPPGLPNKPERNKAGEAEKPKETNMNEARLCRALAAAFGQQAQDAMPEGLREDRLTDVEFQRDLGATIVLNRTSQAFAAAAEALEKDELARLEIHGAQPRELQEPSGDA